MVRRYRVNPNVEYEPIQAEDNKLQEVRTDQPGTDGSASRESIAHSSDDNPKSYVFLRRNWGWVVTFATYILQFTMIGFLYTFGLMTLAIQDEFNSGVVATGWVPAIATSVQLMSAPIAQVLLKKASHRLVAILGVVLCFIACISTSFVQGVVPMYLSFGLLYGVGSGVCIFAGMILIVEYFPSEHRMRASALALAGTTSGMLALNPIVYLVVSRVGWRNTLRIMGSLILGLGLAGSATFSRPLNPKSRTGRGHRGGNATVEEKSTENKIDYKEIPSGNNNQMILQDNHHHVGDMPCRTRHSLEIFIYPEFWMLFLGIVVCETSLTFFLFYWVKYLLSVGFHESAASLSMTVIGGSEVTGKIILAVIGDHLPFPKLFVFHLAIIAGIVVMICLLYPLSLVTMFVVSAASGLLVVSAMNALPFVVSSQIYPTSGTTPMTSSVAAFGIAIVLGNVYMVYGVSMDRTGSFTDALFGCMGTYAASFVLFALVPLYQIAFAPERYMMWKTVKPIRNIRKKKCGTTPGT